MLNGAAQWKSHQGSIGDHNKKFEEIACRPAETGFGFASQQKNISLLQQLYFI